MQKNAIVASNRTLMRFFLRDFNPLIINYHKFFRGNRVFLQHPTNFFFINAFEIFSLYQITGNCSRIFPGNGTSKTRARMCQDRVSIKRERIRPADPGTVFIDAAGPVFVKAADPVPADQAPPNRKYPSTLPGDLFRVGFCDLIPRLSGCTHNLPYLIRSNHNKICIAITRRTAGAAPGAGKTG